jgi:hypothetical protein
MTEVRRGGCEVVRLAMCKITNEGCADSAPILMHKETDRDESYHFSRARCSQGNDCRSYC